MSTIKNKAKILEYAITGAKAREFLLSVSETVADATTLADASGEIKKESVGKDGK